MGIHGMSWKFMEFLGNSWKFLDIHHQVPRISKNSEMGPYLGGGSHISIHFSSFTPPIPW
jgi:hypothetical protein